VAAPLEEDQAGSRDPSGKLLGAGRGHLGVMGSRQQERRDTDFTQAVIEVPGNLISLEARLSGAEPVLQGDVLLPSLALLDT
jgi:hypothetical protein